MTLWYVAHLLMYVKRKKPTAAAIPVWENLILIEAGSEEEALTKAEQRGRQDEGDEDGTFRWEGQPAAWVFAGVRKLTLTDDPEKRPGDGAEVSYTEMEVGSMQVLADLLNGKPGAVKLTEFAPSQQDQVAKQTA